MKQAESTSKWLASWSELNVYGRFEQIIAFVLAILVSVVVVLSIIRLFINLVEVFYSPSDILDYELFRQTFGMIMVVIIALEFNHTIFQIIQRKERLIQVRTVVVIAILAIVRKFVILDIEKTTSLTMFALAAIALALGATYWLIRDADRSKAGTGKE